MKLLTAILRYTLLVCQWQSDDGCRTSPLWTIAALGNERSTGFIYGIYVVYYMDSEFRKGT